MTLPVSPNAISLSQVDVELTKTATTMTSLNDADVRNLFGMAATGQISLSDGWGKSYTTFLTMSTNQTNLNLRTWAISNGWSGSGKAVITISSGVYVTSTVSSTPAMTVNGVWAQGVQLINNGIIQGMGGNGGPGGPGPAQSPGAPGGAAATGILASVAMEINNTSGTIGGGGGGGGGQAGTSTNGAARCLSTITYWAGGGGGGGRTGLTNTVGGAGGGSPVTAGTPGGAGTYAGAGAGGTPGFFTQSQRGGAGGTFGAAGAAAVNVVPAAAGGTVGAGGAAGACTSGSATYITWIATGTRYGSIL